MNENERDTATNSKTSVDTRPVIPAMGEHTRILIALFKDLREGQLLSYEEASKACAREIGPNQAQTAMNRVLVDYNIEIVCQPGVGFRLSVGKESLERRKKGLASARRKSKKELKKLSIVDMTKLSREEQIEAVSIASIQQVIHHMGKPSSVKKLTAAAANSEKTEMLSLGNTLKLFDK